MKKTLSFLVLALCTTAANATWIPNVESQSTQTHDLKVAGKATMQAAVVLTPDVYTYSALSTTTIISPYGHSVIVINGVGTVTMSSAPTISTTAATSGQILTIIGGTNPVTFTDAGSLSNSCLSLVTSTITLSSGDILELIYYNGKWRELGFTNNI